MEGRDSEQKVSDGEKVKGTGTDREGRCERGREPEGGQKNKFGL